MAGPPPLSVQRRIFLNFNKKSFISCDDWEYAVSKNWLEKWQSVISTNQSADLKSLEDSKSKTSMKNLMWPLTMDMKDDSRNEYLLQKWWKILVSWYGLDPAHYLKRRPAIPKYMIVQDKSYFPDRLLDFIKISVCMLQNCSDESQLRHLKVFAWDSLDFIEFQIRKVLNLSSNMKARLWLCLQEDGTDTFFDLLHEKQMSLISKLTIYLPWITDALDKRGQSGTKSDIFKLEKHNITILFMLEEIGFESDQQKFDTQGGWKHFACDMDDTDSIVTLTTIHNQWEDLLTESLDQFTQEVGNLAIEKRDHLLKSAKELVTQKLEETEHLRVELEERLKLTQEKEAILEKREQEVSSREDDLNSKLAKFQSSLDAFVGEKKRLESQWQKIEQQNKISDSKVHLNIGGHLYMTSVDTLSQDPESLLAIMFSGKKGLKREPDGSYFFDRDGTHFRHILNYLRDGPMALEALPEDGKILHELLIESEYYKITVMSELIKEKISVLTEKENVKSSFCLVETI